MSRLEDAVRARPHDADALVQLGYAYQLRWRETGDASYLPRAGAALGDALRARPDDADAVLGLGSLALIRHEFRSALAYGRRARRLLVGSARPLNTAVAGKSTCERATATSAPTSKPVLVASSWRFSS